MVLQLLSNLKGEENTILLKLTQTFANSENCPSHFNENLSMLEPNKVQKERCFDHKRCNVNQGFQARPL